MTKPRDRLRKALRGGFGYREQKKAWDAVMPEWRRLLKHSMTLGRLGKLTPAEIEQFTAALKADGHFLARAWSELCKQQSARDFCRIMKTPWGPPWGWGWFPK